MLAGASEPAHPRDSEAHAVIVGLVGYAGSGKDTVADIMVSELAWHKVSLAEPIYRFIDIFSALQGAPSGLLSSREAKARPGVRELLQDVGDALRASLGERCLISSLMERDDRVASECLFIFGEHNVVLPDVRTQAEADWILRMRHSFRHLELFRPRLVWVERPGVGPVNAREARLGDLRSRCESVVVNAGTVEDLACQVGMVFG